MKSHFIFPLKFSNFLKSFFQQDKYGNNFTQKWNTDKRNINYLLSRSELSMYLIARWYKENNNIDPTIWLPEYFCDQSTKYLSDNGFKIHYYKIKNNLEPDWEYCYKKAEIVEPNIFFLVHYFGNCSDVEETLIFCKKHKSIFVEDCAHVLYPNNRIGIHGDFMIYSPHKFVSIPNGAILVQRQLFKKSVALEDIIDSIPNKYFSAIPWALKNIFKKYIPRFILLLVKNPKEITKNNFNINSKKIELLMHPVSKSLIKVFSKKIENIGLYRRLNFQIFDRIYGNENDTTNSSFDIPYLYTIKYEDVTESKKQYDNFKKNKFDVMKWPDLPQEVIDLKNYSEINELYNRSIFLGIDTNPLKLLKILKPFSKYDYKIEKNESASFIEKIAIKASRPNLIQTLGYSHANIRKKIRTSSYVVYKNQKAISLFFVSIKKFLLAKIIYINRGPLFLENIDDLDQLMIMKSLKRKFKIFKGSLLLISPNLLDTKKTESLCVFPGSNYLGVKRIHLFALI